MSTRVILISILNDRYSIFIDNCMLVISSYFDPKVFYSIGRLPAEIPAQFHSTYTPIEAAGKKEQVKEGPSKAHKVSKQKQSF